MKKNYFLPLMFIMLTSVLNAQWVVKPTPVSGYYYADDIHFIDNNVGFVGGITALIGGNGKISKTSNGGASWTDVFTIPNKTINDFYFVNSNLGFAVGAGGLIAKTTDGGNNWTSQIFINPNTSNPEAFMSVYFVNQNVGYIAGGYYEMMVLKTIDGGVNWTALTMPTYFQRLRTVHFTDANTGYVAGGDGTGGGIGKVYKTINGGTTWDSLSTGIYNNYFNDIIFTDANNGVIGCDINGTLIKTANAGLSWNQVTNPAGTSPLEEFSFVNSTVGYGCILNGKIIKTTDGGNTWSLDGNVSPTMSALYSISVPTLTYGASVGLFGQYAEMGSTSGINDLNSNDKLVIYPNPTNSNLNIEIENSDALVEVFDIFGKMILSQNHVNSQTIINLSSQSKGIYFVKVSADGRVYNQKVIYQ